MGWLQLLGTGISALSQRGAGADAKAAGDAAGDAFEQEAQDRAGKIRKMALQSRGAARAALAAAGADVNSGTATLIDGQIQSDSESDAASTIITGGRQAFAARRGGQIQRQAANINSVGTIVNGLSSESGRSTLSDGSTRFRNWKTSDSSAYGVGGNTSGPR